MFYQSPKHNFDTMFVILCVIAGATSHTISNTSITPINQSSNYYRASFIDSIMDTSLMRHFQSLHTRGNKTLNQLLRIRHTAKYIQPPRTLCALFSNFLTGSQMKLCHKHQDLLKIILPKLYPLTKRECYRISTDLKWSCTLMEMLLDKSSPLAFTREAALIKSILNASMMYLIVKTCSDLNLHSCGCLSRPNFSYSTNREVEATAESYSPHLSNDILNIDPQNFSAAYVSSLNSGNPLKLTRTIPHHQGCTVNVAFADSLTSVLADSDEYKTLNRANQILNEDPGTPNRKRSHARSRANSDLKDLARIKWGKAASNLHNSNVGRQLVRDSIERRCRCHGLSGVCQFRTCWDHIPDIQSITWRLRSIYLGLSSKVQVKDFGTFNEPDLSLVKLKRPPSDALSELNTKQDSTQNSGEIANLPLAGLEHQTDTGLKMDEILQNESIYLDDSPDFCNAVPFINHPGTKDRLCSAQAGSTATVAKFAKVSSNNSLFPQELLELGHCEVLCCRRGYRSQLVMEVSTCNCRFRPCCQVECDDCPRQRLLHFCL